MNTEAARLGEAEHDLRYRLYGRLWSCGESLDHLLPRGLGSPDCRYRVVVGAEPGSWRDSNQIYRSPIPDREGNPRLKIWRDGELVRAFFSDAGAYHLEGPEIVCHPLPDASRPQRDNLLLGAVLAFWMELRGMATLHASAVAQGDRAVGFVSHSGGGKSSLAALLMSRGWRLLTDDVLPLRLAGAEVVGWPGYPMMRMWPEEARHFLGATAGLHRVHPATGKFRVPLSEGPPGEFQDRPTELRRLYFPRWLEDAGEPASVRIEALSPREGLIELVRFSFAPLVVRALGLDGLRFAFLSEAALRVPMRRLLYPRGLAHLPRVARAIERDLAADPAG